MMADDIYSDEESGDSQRGSSGGLGPIVEVPSETPSEMPDENHDNGIPDTDRTEYSDDYEETASDEDAEAVVTARSTQSGRKKNKKRSARNGKYPVDLTPPDKHLKRAESKANKYSGNPKKTDRAMEEFIRCTALARIVYGDGHWRLAKAHADLAGAYFDLRGFAPQAQQHAETAKNIMVNGVTLSTSTEKPSIMETLINIHYILGRAYAVQKKYNPAEHALIKAESITKEWSKLHSVTDQQIDEWRMKIFQALAKLYGKQQKFAVSQEYFDKTLDVMDKVHGPDSLKLIPVYQGMGNLEQSKGGLAAHHKAIEHFEQAHSIASAHCKRGTNEQVADTAYALAMAYANVGEEGAETSAESYLNECLASYQSVHGPHHAKTLRVQDDLARLMMRTDRQKEGIDLLKSTMEAKSEVYGDFSAEVADTWKLIGNVHMAQPDGEKALRALKKCYNVECTLYGTNHKKTKDTQRSIDILMANPNLASKQKKTKADELKSRPRFNSVVSRQSSVGASKPPLY